ncbi:LysR family transcriptional regulator [Salinisphaera sp.]|uniref:LysR family transcriptional regulator n=1 Tax=Salinisphaera sp. TaxID=1914330 RepID=UPI000C48F0EA|nr:LysR family transcriptional regulator [Salinisphaera sp.]MBS61507.1 LysR family transcriptional regulator [Salinisphaera sp.]
MARLNYNQLYYFWAVAREQHLTRAAERLHVSQSSLSAQIKQLEAQLGQALFAREGRGLVLTEAGHLAMNYAEAIFRTGSEMQAMLRDGQTSQRRALRLGSLATLSRNFQENLIQPLMGKTDVELVLQSGTLEELTRRLYVHDLDAILSNKPVQRDSRNKVRCRRIARQPVSVIGPPLPQGQHFDFPADLNQCPVVVPGPSSSIRTGFDLLCERLQCQPDIIAEVDDMAMMRLLARDTGAIAVLPPVVVRDELKNETLQEYGALPGLFEDFYIISAERRFQNPLLEELMSRPAEEILPQE